MIHAVRRDGAGADGYQASSHGYAWGYIGSCIPFVVCLLLVLNCETIGMTMGTAMAVAFALIAAWWFLMSLPLLRGYRQKYYVERRPHAIAESFRRLGRTFAPCEAGKEDF